MLPLSLKPHLVCRRLVACGLVPERLASALGLLGRRFSDSCTENFWMPGDVPASSEHDSKRTHSCRGEHPSRETSERPSPCQDLTTVEAQSGDLTWLRLSGGSCKGPL